jgi:hypothetical protein
MFTDLSEERAASIFRAKDQPELGKIWYGCREKYSRDRSSQVSTVPSSIPVPHVSTVSLLFYLENGSRKLLRKVELIFARLHDVTFQKTVIISRL